MNKVNYKSTIINLFLTTLVSLLILGLGINSKVYANKINNEKLSSAKKLIEKDKLNNQNSLNDIKEEIEKLEEQKTIKENECFIKRSESCQKEYITLANKINALTLQEESIINANYTINYNYVKSYQKELSIVSLVVFILGTTITILINRNSIRK